jgi:hypothetical protein
MEHDELDRIIDSSFKMDPGYQLPAGFADRLVERWEKRTSRQANLKEYGLIVGTVVAILLVLGFTFYVLDREQLIQWRIYLVEHRVFIGSVLFLLNFTLFADRVLLPWLFTLRKNSA